MVDAGPEPGYGHAVRCLRIARRLAREVGVVFYPLSEDCHRFVSSQGREVRSDEPFPELVITDLRQQHGITAEIRRQGCRHVSIHDLGLAQCHSDVLIDGSITTLFPYSDDRDRKMFVGPKYMIMEPRSSERRVARNVALISLGGGATHEFTDSVADALRAVGLDVYATTGFGPGRPATQDKRIHWIRDEAEIRDVVRRSAVAVSGAGVSLYEMLASGIPTIALSFDWLQLRTAEAFEERGATRSAGLISKLKPAELAEHARDLLGNGALMSRLAGAGRKLVDGKGLLRVTEIVRKELCLTT